MAARGIAAATYLPLPGFAWLLARAVPDDRLVRFHARQAGWLVLAAWALLGALGLAVPDPRGQLAAVAASGAIAGLALLGILAGAAAAARGRFVRVRPVWDIVAALAGPGASRTAPGALPRRRVPAPSMRRAPPRR